MNGRSSFTVAVPRGRRRQQLVKTNRALTHPPPGAPSVSNLRRALAEARRISRPLPARSGRRHRSRRMSRFRLISPDQTGRSHQRGPVGSRFRRQVAEPGPSEPTDVGSTDQWPSHFDSPTRGCDELGRMTTDPLLVETRDHITLFTLNRPERRNAYDDALVADIRDAMTSFDADPEQHIGILTGSGDLAFCSGSDLSSRAARSASRPGPIEHTQMFGVGAVRKPMIAAVTALRWAEALNWRSIATSVSRPIEHGSDSLSLSVGWSPELPFTCCRA